MTQIQQFRKGSTPMLILSALASRPMHGYEIMRELERRSEGYFSMTAALLYPALHQLEQDDLIRGDWQGEPGKRRRKVYVLTERGRQALGAHEREWRQFFQNLFKTLGEDHL